MRDLDLYLTNLGRFMEEPVESKSLAELWDYVTRVRQLGGEYFRPNIAISITHATLHKVLENLVQMVFGVEKGAEVFGGLMAFCETKTGQINKELYELALLAKTEPVLLALLQGETAPTSLQIVQDGLLSTFPAFYARFETFVRDHGHRELDFDAYIPSWNESPCVILDNIRLMLRSSNNMTPSDKERAARIAMQRTEQELFKALPEDLHFFFFELLRLARLYTSLDDLEHYQTTRLSIPMRRGLREFGTRLMTEGLLSEPMDIFFAEEKQTATALEVNTREGWKTFAADLYRQKAAYLKAAGTKPEWILGESGLTEQAGEKILTGLPGSGGHAEGSVFVVHSSEDFGRFPKGSILVARTTNPSWTPLFYCAAAVVTESGGPLSHGAVTAREMGIPAVMSVRGCLSRLVTGQRVRVDGTNGKVFLIEKMEE
jgi:pyruvate,water dikinase